MSLVLVAPLLIERTIVFKRSVQLSKRYILGKSFPCATVSSVLASLESQSCRAPAMAALLIEIYVSHLTRCATRIPYVYI